MIHLKLKYGVDSQSKDGTGFYWPGSASKRAEILGVKRGSPSIFEATYQNRPGSREGTIFVEADFTSFIPPSQLNMGCKYGAVKEFLKCGTVIQSWDTAFTKTKDSAFTVCTTGLLVPCNKYHRGEDPETYGPCEFHFDVLILDVFREKLDWAGLIEAFKTQHVKWNPELHLVELRASGIPLFQSIQSTQIPILGIQTEQGKRARAVDGTEAGSAQGWFRQHRVLHPASELEAPWLETWKTEFKDFSGADDALSDQVDSGVHLINYAITTGATSAHLPTDWTPERGTPIDVADANVHPLGTDGRIDTLQLIYDLPSMSFDPFAGTCQRCISFDKSYCNVHKRAVVSLDTCALHTEVAPLAM